MKDIIVFSHIDIDECKNSNPCSEVNNTFCVNIIGSFLCKCVYGYEEDNDSRNCIGWYLVCFTNLLCTSYATITTCITPPYIRFVGLRMLLLLHVIIPCLHT